MLRRTKLKPGKKTHAWEAAKRILKPAFEAAGIMSCEVRGPNCWRSNALGFAHTRKRRNIVGAELLEVALACTNCHQGLEIMPEAQMRDRVREIIQNRCTAVIVSPKDLQIFM